ncbi:MAG: hypothetical protein ACI4MJ_07110 [Aristaeellaceae bacterium]
MDDMLQKMLALLDGVEVRGEANMSRLLACIRAIKDLQALLSKPDREVKVDA